MEADIAQTDSDTVVTSNGSNKSVSMPETVEGVASLSRDDLKALLKNALGDQQEGSKQSGAQVTDDDTDEDDDSQESESEQGQSQAVPDGETEGEEDSASSEEELSEDPKVLQALVRELKKQNRVEQQKGEQKESYIQRNKQRHAELSRKYADLENQKNQLAQELVDLRKKETDLWETSPRDAADAREKIKETEAAVQEIDQEQGRISFVEQSRQIVNANVDPDSVKPQEVVEVMQNAGYSAQIIQQFCQNPYETLQPETIVQIIRHAEDRHMLKVLAAYVKKVNAERSTSDKKSKNIVKTIERNLKAKPKMTASSNGSSQSSKIDIETADPTKMDSATLKAFLAKGNLANR